MVWNRSAAGAVFVVMSVVAACSGSVTETTPEQRTGATSTPAVTSTPEQAPPETHGEWIRVVPNFEPVSVPEQVEPASPEIHLVSDVGSTFVAVGSHHSRLVVWVTSDPAEFAAAYVSEARWYLTGPADIERLGQRLVVTATVEVPGDDGDVLETLLLVSDDDGATWTEVDPPFTDDVFHLVVADDVAIVHGVGAGRFAGDNRLWRSTDLDEWALVELPTSLDSPANEPETHVHVLSDSEIVWIVADRSNDLDPPAFESWYSTDGAESVHALAPRDGETGIVGVVGGRFVVTAEESRTSLGHVDYESDPNTSPWIAEPGGEWHQLPVDYGQWGDRGFGVGEIDNDPDSGRLIASARREIRANPHYCFEDPATCHRSEWVLATSSDGESWSDLEAPLDEIRVDMLSAGEDGSILLWGRSTVWEQRRTPLAYLWTGPDLPPSYDPDTYPPPQRPVPLYQYGEPFPVGSEMRYVLGPDFCAGTGMYVEDEQWAPESPLPDPLPSTWPVRRTDGDHQPEQLVYGRITRTDADEITFSIEGIGPVATYRPQPRDPDAPGCA